MELKRLQVAATVESVKAVSEIYSPISGRISEVNEKLTSTPRLINQEPYGKGWILLMDPLALEEESEMLLKPREYAEYVKRLTRMDRDLLVHRWRRA
jgi:glycine cleavage system H protein